MICMVTKLYLGTKVIVMVLVLCRRDNQSHAKFESQMKVKKKCGALLSFSRREKNKTRGNIP